MGDELSCTKEETNQDSQFILPEKNILMNYPTTKNDESFDNNEELNIIENINVNNNQNNIEQKYSKSIIQNDEFLYERIDTNSFLKNNRNNNLNNKIIYDKEGPQDNIKVTDLENNINNNPIESNIPVNSNIIDKVNDNNINLNINKKFSTIVIDTNKIVVNYTPKKIKNDIINLEENINKEKDFINENKISTNNKNLLYEKKENNIKNNYNEDENNEKLIKELVDDSNNEKNDYNIDNMKTNNENIIPSENIFEKINYTQENNNIQISNIFPEKEVNDKNILSELNLNSNPTFFPINNNNKSYQNNTNNNTEDYSNLINNFNTNEYNHSNRNNNNYDYLFNNKDSEKPLFTDKEVDELIKQAEKNYYKTIFSKNKNKDIYYPLNNLNIQPKTIINNYPYNNQNNNVRILTPEKKKIIYPLTPDYQIRKNKNKNDIFNYNNNYGKQNNVNYINYAPITYPQKQVKKTPVQTNYNYNPINYQSPKRTKKNPEQILYSSPQKKSSNTNYILTPKNNQANQVIIQSPIKLNQPINQYNNLNLNNVTTKPKTLINYSIPVDSDIYQSKRVANPSIINTTYLKSIQQMNKQNHNINNKNSINYSLTNSYNNLNKSFSSSSSSPRQYDKKGNPYYITSVHSSKKLKEYQNSQINKRFNGKYRSLSNDVERKNRFDDDFSNDASSNESPFSAPKNKNYFQNFDLNSINSISSLNSLKNNNNMNNNINYIKPNELYIKKNNYNMNNINNNYTNNNYKSIYPSVLNNNSSISSIEEDTLIDLDEQTKLIIKKYSSLNITSTSNFYPDNYKLFYHSSSPNFSKISPQEFYTNKRIKYFINNDPTKEAIYTGSINHFHQRHGLGQIKEPHCIKIGTWKNNNFSGWGRIIYNNGQVFEGKYDNGKLNGKGIYKYKDILYIGDFENNIRQGKGILINKRFRYNGQFNKGKIDGYGKIIFYEDKEGQGEYEGFFKNNIIEGKGIMKWKNGNIYEGEMKNGKMNGTGKFIPYGGIPIEGVFRNNVKVNVKK